MIDLNKDIQFIKGVGPSRVKLLNKLGINTLEDLTNKTEDDMYMVRNLGKKSLDEVLDKLHLYGLKLEDEE